MDLRVKAADISAYADLRVKAADISAYADLRVKAANISAYADLRVKAEITKPKVLTHYDVNADLKVSADASSYGLGAVLLQKNGHSWQPVMYASRAMTAAILKWRRRLWLSRGHVKIFHATS